MRHLQILVIALGVLSFSLQTDGRPIRSEQDIERSIAIASSFTLGFASVWVGDIVREMIVSRKETEMTTAAYCADLRSSRTQRLLAAIPTLAIMGYAYQIKMSALQKTEFDLGTFIANSIFTYTGAAVGARLMTSLLCNTELDWWQISVGMAFATGIGAALGFNLIW